MDLVGPGVRGGSGSIFITSQHFDKNHDFHPCSWSMLSTSRLN